MFSVRNSLLVLPLALLLLGAGKPVEEKLLVLRASERLIAQWPKGTLLSSKQKICLEAGEFIALRTISSSRKRHISYTGPGCNMGPKLATKRQRAAVRTGATK